MGQVFIRDWVIYHPSSVVDYGAYELRSESTVKRPRWTLVLWHGTRLRRRIATHDLPRKLVFGQAQPRIGWNNRPLERFLLRKEPTDLRGPLRTFRRGRSLSREVG